MGDWSLTSLTELFCEYMVQSVIIKPSAQVDGFKPKFL